MVEEKEMYQVVAGKHLLKTTEDVIWAEDLFDLTLIPYIGKWKQLDEIKNSQPYELVVVLHDLREVRVIDTRADVAKDRLYIDHQSFARYWKDIKRSVALSMQEHYGGGDPQSILDGHLLKEKRTAKIRPVQSEISAAARRKQSLLDNQRYFYYYEKNSGIFHDKECWRVAKIDPEAFRASEKRPAGMLYCNGCVRKLYARLACRPVTKELPFVERLFRKWYISISKLMYYIECCGMEIHSNSLSEARIKCGRDLWLVHINDDDSIDLWHNNYTKIAEGERYIMSGFHDQNIHSKSLFSILERISHYSWEMYHTEKGAAMLAELQELAENAKKQKAENIREKAAKENWKQRGQLSESNHSIMTRIQALAATSTAKETTVTEDSANDTTADEHPKLYDSFAIDYRPNAGILPGQVPGFTGGIFKP